MYLHRANWHSSTTLTEGFPCLFFSCKTNARVKPCKDEARPAVFQNFELFYVLLVLCRSVYCLLCKCVLYCCHWVATQLQLTYISYHTIICSLQGNISLLMTSPKIRSLCFLHVLSIFFVNYSTHWHYHLPIYCQLCARYLSRYSDWATGWTARNRIPVGTRFSAPVQTGHGTHPASCKMGTGSFPGVKYGRGVLLTTHPPSSVAVIEE